MQIFYPWVKSRTKPGILVMLNIPIKIALLNGMKCGLADRQLLKDFGVISSVDAKCSCRSLSIMSATNVWSEPSNSSRVTVLGQSLGWNAQPISKKREKLLNYLNWYFGLKE